MPLTLDCVEPQPGVMICEITRLTFIMLDVSGSIGNSFWELLGGPTEYLLQDIEPTEIDLTPVADWIAAWDDLYLRFSAQRSLSSDLLERVFANFYIESDFTCEDSDGVPSGEPQSERHYNRTGAIGFCSPDEVDLWANGSIGGGSLNGWIRKSAPLADCFGFDVSTIPGPFAPPLTDAQFIDMDGSSAPLCLFAQGGAEPYRYVISEGKLPSGLTLNVETGCIDGEIDGLLLGSELVTFQVWDAANNSAEVTCGFLRSCVVRPDLGNVFY